jgi:hypothetical protein
MKKDYAQGSESHDVIDHTIEGNTLTLRALSNSLIAAQFTYECDDGGFCFQTCYWDGNEWVCTTVGFGNAED